MMKSRSLYTTIFVLGGHHWQRGIRNKRRVQEDNMMNDRTRARRKSTWLRLTCLTSLCAALYAGQFVPAQASATGNASAASNRYQPASIRAKPGLQCELHAPGTAAAQGIPVATDSDGYARFYAVRASQGKAGHWLRLDCTDSSGKASTYRVDLASADTFASRPLNLGAEPGKDRPPLAGNPMQWTQAQLVQRGYGWRPDPQTSPGAYEQWLTAARADARMLVAPLMHGKYSRATMSVRSVPAAEKRGVISNTATSATGPNWVGTVLTGSPKYAAVQGKFNVPTAIGGGDQTGTTQISIWNGLGGYGTGSGLIQSGVQLYTTSNSAGYLTFREYCCGDPYSNGYGGAFTPNPGDEIFAQNWYCDAHGNINVNGGYGCSQLQDLTSGAILSCTVPNGSPCWSVPATKGMTLGLSAESVIENETSSAFTDFSPAVTMTGTAYSTRTHSFSRNIVNDPSLTVLTDFTHATSHIVVTTTHKQPATVFTMEAAQPSYPLYCHGPLKTTTKQVPTPTTVFKWADKAAHATPPGPGQCAWADRPPRPGEKRPGDKGIIFGYLNQLANLRAHKYAEVLVYRDPGFGNDFVVTQIVGFVSPPF